MGWENVFHCEWNKFGQKVLKHYWPNAESFTDITKTDFTRYANRIDILTGGFPCQPYSLAGKRKGKEDERHLWPEMLRAIREIQPTWVVGENVFGLINWSDGLVFDEVQADLEAEGYEVQPYVLPACAVNAPHRRDRVWFVAHSISSAKGSPKQSGRTEKNWGNINTQSEQWRNEAEQYFGCFNFSWDATNADSNGQYRSDSEHEINTGEGGEYAQRDIEQMGRDAAYTERIRPSGQEYWTSKSGQPTKKDSGSRWQNFPTQSPVRNVNDGISGIMERNIKPEIYATIKERYTDKDLQEVWEHIQSEDVQREIGRLYKIHDTYLLFKTMQLCSTTYKNEGGFSDFSEEASKDLLRKLSNYGSFTNTPQGRELEKQFTEQFANTLPKLSHEIALVTMETERASRKFASWHRNESIKAAGNAIVPQVALQIFKSIQEYELTNNENSQNKV